MKRGVAAPKDDNAENFENCIKFVKYRVVTELVLK